MTSCITIKGGYRQYEEIGFAKGLSIFAIVLMHLIQSRMNFLPNWFLKGVSLGGSGVHVFFFCSGFGLYMSYLNSRISLKEFAYKRFLKVYIPYVIVVLLYFITPTIEIAGNRVIALLSHVFLFKMFLPQYDESIGVFWFISTIIQFYLAFLLLCKIKEKAGSRFFIICSSFISILWWYVTLAFGVSNVRVFSGCFLQYLWEFSLGMVIAEILMRRPELKINISLLIISTIIGFALEGIMAFSDEKLRALNDIPALLGFLSVTLLLFQIKAIRKLFIFVAMFSYEWYLVHILIFEIAYAVIEPKSIIGIVVVGIISLMVSICAAIIYHYLMKILFDGISKHRT